MKVRITRLIMIIVAFMIVLTAVPMATLTVKALAGQGPLLDDLQQSVPATVPNRYKPIKRHYPRRYRTTRQALPAGEHIGRRRIVKVIGDLINPELYAFLDNGWMYRSFDAGKNWVFVTKDPGATHFLISTADENVLYSGAGSFCNSSEATGSPFLRSRNGGVNWEEVADGVDLVPLLTHPSERNTVYAADCAMLFISEDGGTTWQFRADDSESTLWDIYRVNSMGATYLSDGPAAAAVLNHLYAAGNADDGSSAVGYTTDGGLTWVRSTPAENGPSELLAITADVTDPQQLWLLSTEGVWATTDGGASWTLLNEGLDDLLLFDIVAHPSDRLYVATSNGLYQKAADSNSWSRVKSNDFGDYAIFDLVFNVDNASVLWLNTEDGVFRYPIK